MIRLHRDIPIYAFEVQATVAVGRDRPEFLAVAMLARDLGPIDGSTVARELLGRLPAQVGWRVVERAIGLGLLEREGTRGPAHLSEAGRAAVDQGQVLVPEEGIWRFYLTEDPLIRPDLLHAERVSVPDAKAERKQLQKAKKEGGARPGPGMATPGVLHQVRGSVLPSALVGTPFQVREVGSHGEWGSEGHVRLDLRWAQGQGPELRLNGNLADGEGKRFKVDQRLPLHPPLSDLHYDELWVTLIEEALGIHSDTLFHWMQTAGVPVVPTTMDRWTDAQRTTFQADIDVPRFDLDDLGRFQATKLESVNLLPESEVAAQAWADWLHLRAINRYVTRSDLDGIAKDVRGRFPLHRPRLPSPDELLETCKRDPSRPGARFVLAPFDLGLWS